MKRLIPVGCAVAVFLALLITVVAGQSGDRTSPYSRYEAPKVVTELEWRLLRAEVKLGDGGADLLYDPKVRTFEATYFLLTTDVAHGNASVLRENLTAQAEKAVGVLGVLLSGGQRQNSQGPQD